MLKNAGNNNFCVYLVNIDLKKRRYAMSKNVQVKQLETDILIIGGGTAGCYAALTIRENSNASVLILEKANIKRSGCLAAE